MLFKTQEQIINDKANKGSTQLERTKRLEMRDESVSDGGTELINSQIKLLRAEGLSEQEIQEFLVFEHGADVLSLLK